MLYELRVENLLLLERAELRLGPGLNVLTGETGAGKTLLAHALDLLLGGRARAGLVRGGAAEAYVEGVFELPDDLRGGADQRIPADAQELVLARRLWPDGHTRAYICGRAATVAGLRELGGRMLSFYGQHEHRKLTLAAAQLDALDSFCGAQQLALRERMTHAHQRVRKLEAEVAALEAEVGARERELDLIGFELHEIEQVAPSVEEERELAAQRERLRNAELLRRSAAVAADALAPEDGEGASVLLARAGAALGSGAGFDRSLAALSERLAALRYESEDVALELRSYLERLDAEPGRLESVEERLAQFARLARKHGGGIERVLEHAERCRRRLRELEHADVTLGESAAKLERAVVEREQIGAQLSAARARAAPQLARAVRKRLAGLAMQDARFEISLSARDGGYGPRGRDEVEFLIAPNPGLPAGPLREIASGGELSRVMLALLSAAHGARRDQRSWRGDDRGRGDGRGGDGGRGDERGGDGGRGDGCRGDREHGDGQRAGNGGPLLVFDEIDAGVGGHTARAVGAHLRELACGRQLLCITHLPQVAAMAGTHFTITKDSERTPARTTVSALTGEAVVAELVRMLGANANDRAASSHARELLKAA